jgi:hypothetical protein
LATDPEESRESPSAGEPSGWFLIVRDGTCTECGLTASSVGARDLGSAIIAEALQWVELINSLSHTSSLSTRPTLDVWSALEYAGHASDTLALFADRIRLALTEEDPQFEFQDQDAAVINERYNDQDSDVVAGRIWRRPKHSGFCWTPCPKMAGSALGRGWKANAST